MVTNTNNFIIFFQGREGTTALINLLNNFEQISIVRQASQEGWEPFDRHGCGSMSLDNFRQCFNLIYSNQTLDFEYLNQIYLQTAKNPLAFFDKNKSVGFKMRFAPPNRNRGDNQQELRKLKQDFQQLIFDLLKKHKIVTFVAIRQDVLRRSLSKYHGDGTKQDGHLQFKLAKGLIKKEDIPKIYVDCEQLEKIITQCEQNTQRKRDLIAKMKQSGISAYPLLYEEFCSNQVQYFQDICQKLKIDYTQAEIEATLSKGTQFQKVHSDDISEFVINYEEVIDRFSDRYLAWEKF